MNGVTEKDVVERQLAEDEVICPACAHNFRAISQADQDRLRSQGGGVPEGWKLVPDNPNEEMFKAARGADINKPPHPLLYSDFSAIYAAMLSASPQPPAGGDGISTGLASALKDLMIYYQGTDEQQAELQADFSGPDGLLPDAEVRKLVFRNAQRALAASMERDGQLPRGVSPPVSAAPQSGDCYATVNDWLDETENFSLRRERLPEGALPWIEAAWNLGRNTERYALSSAASAPAPDEARALREALRKAQQEFFNIREWASCERAPLRPQEIASISRVIDDIDTALSSTG